jgi:hypothetical protein
MSDRTDHPHASHHYSSLWLSRHGCSLYPNASTLQAPGLREVLACRVLPQMLPATWGKSYLWHQQTLERLWDIPGWLYKFVSKLLAVLDASNSGFLHLLVALQCTTLSSSLARRGPQDIVA